MKKLNLVYSQKNLSLVTKLSADGPVLFKIINQIKNILGIFNKMIMN